MACDCGLDVALSGAFASCSIVRRIEPSLLRVLLFVRDDTPLVLLQRSVWGRFAGSTGGASFVCESWGGLAAIVS